MITKLKNTDNQKRNKMKDLYSILLREFLNEAEYQGKKVTLNKPFRTPDGPKKFSVYVMGKKGKVIKVNFGDKSMEIKDDSPKHKKSYCARSAGIEGGGKDKTKANYWSRRQWHC